MDDLKKISVIIPTYNRANTIAKAIHSVLNQTYPISEVIVADDGSTDQTEDVVNSISDERVRYCKLPENRGAGGARNFGVAQAKYDWIAFHDSDDEWLANKIEMQVKELDKQPDCGLVYTAYRLILHDGTKMIVPRQDAEAKLSGDIFVNLLLQNSVGAPTILMKKSIFYEVGGFDECLRSLEDWDFAIRVAERYHIAFVPDPLLEVNLTEGSVSTNKEKYYQSRCYMLRKYGKQYLETGAFNLSVMVILKKAEQDGVQEQVEKMIRDYFES